MPSRFQLALLLVLASVATPGSLKASSFAFNSSADRSGDSTGSVGLQIADDFTVNAANGINVTQLGLFIDGYDGGFVTAPSESHHVALINRTNGQVITSTIIGSSFDTIQGPFFYNNPQNTASSSPNIQGAYGYVNIPTQLLPNGFQGSIVAYNMSDAGSYVDDYGEGASFNTGGGLISFSNSYLTASGNTTGDPTGAPSTTPRAGATFTFSAAAPTPEPTAFAVFALSGALCLRRRR